MSGCETSRSRLRNDCVGLAVPQPTERQRIGNQIDTAIIFARAKGLPWEGKFSSDEPSLRFYRSLRAVKVLLALLRSTLTVLAPRMGGLYQFALGQKWLIWQRPMHLAGPLSASSRSTFSGHATIRLLSNTAIIAEFRRILKIAKGCRSP